MSARCFGDFALTHRLLAALPLALLATAGPALAVDPFTASVPVRDGTAEVSVTFHDDRATMVTCTKEQADIIGARALERLTELLPVLSARLVSKGGGPGAKLEVLLDAACYEGGIMALGAYGKGEEKIRLAYEESTDGKEWGPPKRVTVTN